MKIILSKDHEAMSREAAGWIARELGRNPRLLICMATGSSPARTYELLGARARKSPALFKQVRVLKLDEWGGLPIGDPGSSEAYLQEKVVKGWGISKNRFAGFVTDPKKSKTEGERIHNWIERNGPIDICVLGLGLNGHLGFNEPGDTLSPTAHRAVLKEETRVHPMIAHSPVKPNYGLTLGMAEILQSRHILLLVSGAHKREPFKRLILGEISTHFPASLLSVHPQTIVFCDEAATPAFK
jgi:galactosamine-6-phosphate isomerase